MFIYRNKKGQQPTSVLRQVGGRASIDNFVYNLSGFFVSSLVLKNPPERKAKNR
jgi:hypothetical protein